jgi:integrase
MAKYTHRKNASVEEANPGTTLSPAQQDELKWLRDAFRSLGRRTTEQAYDIGEYLARAKSILRSEIEWNDKVWRIPATRMKGKREHAVPLSDGAVQILKTMDSFRREGNDFIFAGQKAGKGLSVMALTMAMRRLEVGQFTPHGFRSAFRDWAGDATSFARDDIEMCLAHAIGNKVEAAYRRGRALEKRREIMGAWWRFLSSDSSNVTPLNASLSSAS